MTTMGWSKEEIYAEPCRKIMTEMVITPTDISAAQGSFSSGVTTPDVDTVTSEPEAIGSLENISYGGGTHKDVN